MHIILPTEADTVNLGQVLAKVLTAPAWVYLVGDLGAGKTCLTRAFLASKGYVGKVKSPTYTLVESYAIAPLIVYHFDLYRIESAHSLEEIGIRDYEGPNVIALCEWPEKAEGALPEPTLILELQDHGKGRVAVLKGDAQLLAAIAHYINAEK